MKVDQPEYEPVPIQDATTAASPNFKKIVPDILERALSFQETKS